MEIVVVMEQKVVVYKIVKDVSRIKVVEPFAGLVLVTWHQPYPNSRNLNYYNSRTSTFSVR